MALSPQTLEKISVQVCNLKPISSQDISIDFIWWKNSFIKRKQNKYWFVDIMNQTFCLMLILRGTWTSDPPEP